jgi:tetratricopeptide (TPR) repeat protein
MNRARGRISIILFVLVTAAVAGWWFFRDRPAPPPDITALGSMAPEVAALLTDLRAAIADDADNPDAWGRFAMACEANGFVGAARDAYAVATRLAPREPRWTYRLALVTSRLGEPEAAWSALARTNELAPEYAPAWSRRGDWLLDRGDPDGAEAAFGRALAIESGNLRASTGMARVHLHRRDYQRAAQVLEQALERHPGDRYALQLLGTAYGRLGRPDDALIALAVGAQGEPAFRDPWSEEIGKYRRGFATTLKAATAEAMAGRFDRALPLFEQLRQQNPSDVSLANHTAEVLTAAGRPAEAIRLLTSMVNARSDNADTHVGLASAYLASGDPARAETSADRAIALQASGARALEIKGMIAWRAGQRPEAAALFERALARDPRHVRLLSWIGLIALEDKRPRDATLAFTQVLRRDPLQADALAGLALAQLALGDREQASAALRRAEQVAPGHPRVREARQHLDRAVHP